MSEKAAAGDHLLPHQAGHREGPPAAVEALPGRDDNPRRPAAEEPRTGRWSSSAAAGSGYLVATDVVGRGIDVTNISHIINYDIPQFADDYIHRVGRAGRMGREGVAYTFVSPEEGQQLTRIEIRINRLLVRRETQDLLPSCTSGRRPVRGAPAAAPRELADEAAIEPNAAPARPATKPVFGRPMRRIRRALSASV